MTHTCKKVNKREFTRRIYKHIGANPILITNRGNTEAFYASINSANSINNAIGVLTDLKVSLGEGVEDEKEHNH